MISAPNSNNQTITKGTIRSYGAGGAGTNITSRLEGLTASADEGYAKLLTTYIDTSKSNTIGMSGVPSDKFYLIPARDGSGKLRTENREEIREHARAILQKHAPGDLNLVNHSGGGGSGSVIGPVLVRELVMRDLPVIVFMVGSAESVQDAKNTLATLKTYEGIVKSTGKPITLVYMQNTRTARRAEIDRRFVDMNSALAMLFSRGNKELDTQDLLNWLRIDRATNQEPRLTVLSIFGPDDVIGPIGNLLSLATLTHGDLDTSFNNQVPAFHAIGYVQSADQGIISKLPVHFAISDGILGEATASMNAVVDEHQISQDSMIRSKPLLGKEDKVDADGFCWD